MIDPIRELENENLVIEEFNLMANAGLEFWNSNILNSERISIAGGSGPTKDISRKIAFAEYLERSEFRRISESSKSERSQWGLDIIPTGCGFAAGFNLRNTIFRSIGEAVERWVMSKWIDDNFVIKKVKPIRKLDPVSMWFHNQFDSIDYFKHETIVKVDENFHQFFVGVTVAYKDGGVFIGSSAQFTGGTLWQHALLESYRHFLQFKNGVHTFEFPDNKIRFFAVNKEIAKNQIDKAKFEVWPLPSISFHTAAKIDTRNFYLARTIVAGWSSWSEGPLERFLY